MTIFQIIALCLAGPIALMTLLQLVITLFYKNQNTFSGVSAFALCISVTALLVAFLGVK